MSADPIVLLNRIMAEREWSRGRLAKEIGVDRAHLGGILLGHRPPGPRVLAYLGLEEITEYRPRK